MSEVLYYKAAATNDAGTTTVVSNEISVTATRALSDLYYINLRLSAYSGMTKYYIYKRQDGQFGKIATLTSSALQLHDTGIAPDLNDIIGTGDVKLTLSGTPILSDAIAHPEGHWYGLHWVAADNLPLQLAVNWEAQTLLCRTAQSSGDWTDWVQLSVHLNSEGYIIEPALVAQALNGTTVHFTGGATGTLVFDGGTDLTCELTVSGSGSGSDDGGGGGGGDDGGGGGDDGGGGGGGGDDPGDDPGDDTSSINYKYIWFGSRMDSDMVHFAETTITVDGALSRTHYVKLKVSLLPSDATWAQIKLYKADISSSSSTQAGLVELYELFEEEGPNTKVYADYGKTPDGNHPWGGTTTMTNNVQLDADEIWE